MDWEIYFENPTSRFDQFVDEEKTIIRADTKEGACAIVRANLGQFGRITKVYSLTPEPVACCESSWQPTARAIDGRRYMDTNEQTTETIEITRCVHHYMPDDFPILKYDTVVKAVAALLEWYKSDRDYIRREWDKDKQRLRQARVQRDVLLKQIADSCP